jgi:hypothetical protein
MLFSLTGHVCARKENVTRTYRTRMLDRGLYDITVQVMEVSLADHADIMVAPDRLDIFTLEEPVKMDVLSFEGVDPANRNRIHRWDVAKSAVENCVSLVTPRVISPLVQWRCKTYPVLCLLDMLKADGWKPHLGAVDHSLDSAKMYDARAAETKRRYYQCLLMIVELFGAGAEPFLSTRPQSFFELLMKNPLKARSMLSAKECSRLLKSDNVEESALQDAMEARRAKRARRGDIVAVADEEFAGDGGLAAPVMLAAEPPPAPLVPIRAPSAERPASISDSSSSSSGSATESASSGSSEGFAGGEDVPVIYSEFIEGVRVKQELHSRHGTLGLRVSCPNPLHPNCSKYRSVQCDAGIFGPRAAEFYLRAWLVASNNMSLAEHKRFRPTRAQTREAMEP